ncbi:hypothetical protein IWQ57_005684 [Coemansia nantahalensis]|uniref:Uncharacterized protein n=1 Tax=Coemansia nantahalensis TaxID=2789366 RepID=A0ACC1JLZ7_9FUNG|nr:hypothetical protein IWQ57_005684 [Coemansia nantahalensis]
MMVGLYMHRLPAGLQALVLTQPPGATLSQIMDVVEHRVNADAAVHGGTPMDVDAVSFGWNDGSGSGNGISAPRGGRSGASGSGSQPTRDPAARARFEDLRRRLREQGVDDATLNDRARRNACLKCGAGGHRMAQCTGFPAGAGQ